MKIYKQVWLFYIIAALSIAALVTFGLLYMEKNNEQVQYIDAVERTYKVLSSIDFCEKSIVAAESAQRGYLLTNDTQYLSLFKANLPLIDVSLKTIGDFTADNGSQKTFFFQLTKFVTTRVEILKESVRLNTADSFYLENVRIGTNAMDYCIFYMGKMRAVEQNLLSLNLANKNKKHGENLSFFQTTFILSCVICILSIIIFFREFGIRLKAQQNLKAKIAELSNSKQELEEITFAASHDLQEPMRKVRILSNLVTKKLTKKIPEEELEVVNRINKITEQMHGLLTDLVLYTNLLNPNEKYADVNLYDLFKECYYKVFNIDEVQFRLHPKLPVIRGSHHQLENMIVHIFENAVKFKTPGTELSVTINYELKPVKGSKFFWMHFRSKKYHEITITDNGIGFDNQYQDKIFGLFQRLHTQTEYSGKGIGLSVARRVMINHNGYISAVSEKKTGTSFILHFPDIS